jgi:hypothetical protein
MQVVELRMVGRDDSDTWIAEAENFARVVLIDDEGSLLAQVEVGFDREWSNLDAIHVGVARYVDIAATTAVHKVTER